MTDSPVRRSIPEPPPELDSSHAPLLQQDLHDDHHSASFAATGAAAPPVYTPSSSDISSKDQSHPSPPRVLRKSDTRRSIQSSRSDSDLELEEMGGRRDHGYHRANGRTSEESTKLNREGTDWEEENGLFDPAEPQTGIDSQREARKEGTRQFLLKATINTSLILAWYFLSIAMSVYNKWMFAPDNLDFHFPLFTTSVHMLVQFFLASVVLFAIPSLRPSNARLPDAHNDSPPAQPPPPPPHEHTNPKPKPPIMTSWFYLTRIATCGAVTGLDIGLGNTSLKFVTLTFFTMCKSSVLGFVLLFAILFRLESPSLKIFSIIAVMTIGVIMMVAGETAFDATGFALLMSASFFSGLRWSLTQILLRRTAATSNPFSTLFFITPVMFLTLFIIAAPSEGFSNLKEGLDSLAAQKGLALGIGIVLFPGCIAFCMTAAEFALLKRTSVVTLSVCGIFKEVLTITAAGIIFGDELTPINISGLCVTIAAIAVYNVTRVRRMRRKEVDKARERIGGAGGNGEVESMAPMAMEASRQGGNSWDGQWDPESRDRDQDRRRRKEEGGHEAEDGEENEDGEREAMLKTSSPRPLHS